MRYVVGFADDFASQAGTIREMERWVWIGALLTALLGASAAVLLLITNMTTFPSPFVIPMWFSFLIAPATLYFAYSVLRRGFHWSSVDHDRALAIFTGYWLLALNLSFFGWLKPQLAYVVPFSADPFLAGLDRFIFGVDPWTVLGWFKHDWLPFFYHEGWFIWLAVVLCVVMVRKPSPEKNRLIVSYFAIWTLFGPLVHLAMPAAGPVFFDELGYGNRFAGLHQDPQTLVLTNYLWGGYVYREFNAGGGISAMPSVHLATMAWSIIALRGLFWKTVATAFTLYILLGSIVLGWHYAVDGIVGLIGGWVCYLASSLGQTGISLRRPHVAASQV